MNQLEQSAAYFKILNDMDKAFENKLKAIKEYNINKQNVYNINYSHLIFLILGILIGIII